jgi:hypothetical protein
MKDIEQNPYTDFYVVSARGIIDEVKETIDRSQYMIADVFDAGYNGDVDSFTFSGMRIQSIQ